MRIYRQFFCRDESGTDFFILGIDQSTYKAKEDMAKATLRYFWAAILDGILEVLIDDILISKETFNTNLDRFFPERDDDAIRNHFYKLNPRPYAAAYIRAGTSERFRLITKDLLHLGSVKLYINADNSSNRDKAIYMRKNKMVIQTGILRSHYGVYCVFVCESDKGNQLLRKMENASHDKWDKSNYTTNNIPNEDGKEALKEIENFIEESLRSIFDRENGGVIEVDGLNEYLSSTESLLDEQDAILSKNSSDALYGIQTEESGNKETGSKTSSSTGPKQNSPASTSSIYVSGEDLQGYNLSNIGSENTQRSKIIRRENKPPTAKKPRNKTRTSFSETPENVKPLMLRSRMVAQFLDGFWWYHLLLYANQDITQVRLYLKASGEDEATPIPIAEAVSSDGKVLKTAGNMIAGLDLVEGKNSIRIRLQDNMKYALILDGYEA